MDKKRKLEFLDSKEKGKTLIRRLPITVGRWLLGLQPAQTSPFSGGVAAGDLLAEGRATVVGRSK